jgi:hypothetical protein
MPTTTFYLTILLLAQGGADDTQDPPPSPLPAWIKRHRPNDIHFIKRGRMIGSLNYAHLVLDINLGNLEANITKLCQTTQHITDVNQTAEKDTVDTIRQISEAIHDIEIERCLLLAEDYANTVNVWLDAPQEVEVKATRFRSKDGIQLKGTPIFSKITSTRAGRSTDRPATEAWERAEEEVEEEHNTWSIPEARVGRNTDSPVTPEGGEAEQEPSEAETWAGDTFTGFSVIFHGNPYFDELWNQSGLEEEWERTRRQVEEGWGRPLEEEEQEEMLKPVLEAIQIWEALLEHKIETEFLEKLHKETTGSWPAPGTGADQVKEKIRTVLEANCHLTANTGIQWSDHAGITLGSWTAYMAYEWKPKRSKRSRRVKRQFFILGFLLAMGIAAIGSYLFSQNQVAQLSLSTGTDEHAIQVLQEHEAKTSINNRSIEILRLAEKADQRRLFSLDLVSLQIMGSLTKDEAEKEIRRIITAVQLLSKNRLSPDLIQTDQLGQVVISLKDKAAKKGLVLGITSKEDIFRVDTSHIFFANRTLRIMVHVPAYRADGLLDLYEYVPVPLPLTPTKFVVPTPVAGLLAVSPGKLLFRTMSHDTLHDCDRLLDLYFCHRQNMYDKRYTDDCMVALYNSDYGKVAEKCPVQVQPKEDFLVQLNSSHFILYQPELGDIDRRCGGIIQTARVKGIVTVVVGPGCRVDARSYIFDGALAIYNEGYELQQRVMNFSRVISPELRENLEKMKESELAELKLIGSSKGVFIRDLEREFAERRQTTVFAVTLMGLMGVVGVIVICLCGGRILHLCKKKRDSGAVWFGANPPRVTLPVARNEEGEMERMHTRGPSTSGMQGERKEVRREVKRHSCQGRYFDGDDGHEEEHRRRLKEGARKDAKREAEEEMEEDDETTSGTSD